jgi:hypothetical protein
MLEASPNACEAPPDRYETVPNLRRAACDILYRIFMPMVV